MAGMARNGLKRLEIAEIIEMAGNGWKWLKTAELAENSWNCC